MHTNPNKDPREIHKVNLKRCVFITIRCAEYVFFVLIIIEFFHQFPWAELIIFCCVCSVLYWHVHNTCAGACQIVFEILLREQTLDTANLLLSVTKPPDGYDSQYYDSLLKSLVAWDPSALKQVTDLCLDLLKVTDSSVIDKTLDFLKWESLSFSLYF